MTDSIPGEHSHSRKLGAALFVVAIGGFFASVVIGAQTDDDSGNVGASDFLALLANWGPCP